MKSNSKKQNSERPKEIESDKKTKIQEYVKQLAALLSMQQTVTRHLEKEINSEEPI